MLKINHLNKTFSDGTVALTDINIEVEKGDIYGIIGLSGNCLLVNVILLPYVYISLICCIPG